MSRENGSAWVKWLIFAAVVAVTAGGGIWYWKAPHGTDPNYRTAEIARGDIIQTVTATGQLDPMTNVLVGTQVSGTIQKLYVDFNSLVTNGEPIAQLDPANYKAQLAQAQGNLANAKATLELAQAEVERNKSLYDSQIIDQSDYDTAVATFHQGQAQVEINDASVQQAKVNLAYTTIYAPVDGIVIARDVDVGQTVAASMSTPTLYQIANDLAHMQIDALVSEADIGGVQTNQSVNFTVDAYPLRTFQGTVLQIRNNAQTNQNVITYDTVIGVDNSDLKLRPGMTANVSIITAAHNNQIRIPNAALRFHPADVVVTNTVAQTDGQASSGGGDTGQSGHKPGGGHAHAEHPSRTVYLLHTDGSGKQTAEPVQVRVGISDGVFTQVNEGLKEGDMVIVGENSVSADNSQGGSNPFGGMRRF
jgi:HlyD family secretion protein